MNYLYIPNSRSFSSIILDLLKFLKFFIIKNKFKEGRRPTSMMQRKPGIKTTSLLHLTISFIHKQLYYMLTSIIFFLKRTTSGRQNGSGSLRSDSKPIGSKVNLNEDSGCLKITDESVSFSLKNSVMVITDVIDSTRLFNEHPQRMKHCIFQHYKTVILLLRTHSGHLVANEGDSFHIAFQNFKNAIKFCKDLISQHRSGASFFQVRVGINKGKLCVRKFCGYKVFGESIDETLDFFRDNDGKHICIKKRLVDRYGIEPDASFCMHL